MLIDYLDDQLTSEDRKTVEAELNTNAECQELYNQLKGVIGTLDSMQQIEPSTKGIEVFQKNLQLEINKKPKQKVVRLWPSIYKVAAAVALVVAGGGIGYWINNQQQHQDELRAMKEEIERTKQLVIDRLNDPYSASQRILAVKAAYNVEQADDQIVDALITVMNTDANSNVRISALQALGKFYHEEKIKNALISSLTIQTDPTVQIALIQLLVQQKEKGAIKPLEEMIENEDVTQVVKDEAHTGLFKIS